MPIPRNSLLFLAALAGLAACSDPECHANERKIGTTCFPLPAHADAATSDTAEADTASDAGRAAARADGGHPNDTRELDASSGSAAAQSAADAGAGNTAVSPASDASIASADACVVAAEVCDGQDNNCDGVVDNGVAKNECGGCTAIPPEHATGMSCSNGGKAACDLPGAYACLGGTTVCNAPPPTKTTEVCDGKDNDCDGVVDNGVPKNACGGCGVLAHAKNEACKAGLGACEASGVYACTPDNESTLCTAVAKAGSVEICDGKDNDCDGQTDEDGVCVPACTARRWYRDCDADGYAASAANSAFECNQPALAVNCLAWTDVQPVMGSIDCNDSDAEYRPGADFGFANSGNGDRNCDGVLDLLPKPVKSPDPVVFPAPAKTPFCGTPQDCQCYFITSGAKSPPCAKGFDEAPLSCVYQSYKGYDSNRVPVTKDTCGVTLTFTQTTGSEDLYSVVQTCR